MNIKSAKDDRLFLILLLAGAFVWSLQQGSVQTAAVRLFVILLCLPVHELAHAWTAYKLGDPTAKRLGRVSLNPLRHLSLEGTIFMFLFGFGFAKPVPVSTAYFPPDRRKQYYALTSLAGPASNLLMAVIFLLIGRFFLRAQGLSFDGYTVCSYLVTAAYINVALAVFNLLPIPPLDGSSLLALVLPGEAYRRWSGYQRYLILAIFLLSFLLHRAGLSPLSAVTGAVMRFLTGLIL